MLLMFSSLIFLSSLATANSDISSVNIYSNHKTIESCNFGVSSYLLYFENPTDTPVVVQITPEGAGASFVTLSQNTLLLSPGDKETVSVFVNPNNKAGNYTVKFFFTLNDEFYKELSQNFVFTHCKTFNVNLSNASVCYENKSNITFQVTNLRKESLNIRVSFNRHHYDASVAPLYTENLTLPYTARALRNVTNNLVVEDKETGYAYESKLNINVLPCGFVQQPSVIIKAFKWFKNFVLTQWRIIFVILLIILVILIIIWALRKRNLKNKEPAVEVIQAVPDLSEVKKAKKEEKETKKETIELSKKPYYESALTTERKSIFKNKIFWTIVAVIVLIIIGALFIHFGILNRTPSNVTNATNITKISIVINGTTVKGVVNATENVSAVPVNSTSLSSKLFGSLKNSWIDTWKFMKIYKYYFIWGVIIAIIIIFILNSTYNKETEEPKTEKKESVRKNKSKTAKTKKAGKKKSKRKSKKKR